MDFLISTLTEGDSGKSKLSDQTNDQAVKRLAENGACNRAQIVKWCYINATLQITRNRPDEGANTNRKGSTRSARMEQASQMNEHRVECGEKQ